MKRRKFLAGTGSAITAALAGCPGDSSSETDTKLPFSQKERDSKKKKI